MIYLLKMVIYSGFTYWKWWFIVDLPIENGGSFHSYVSCLPEGTQEILDNLDELSMARLA